MKTLLVVTAAVEAATGLTLLVSPSVLASALLGSELVAPVGLAVGRIAGAGLLALGTACWLARNDGASGAARGLVTAMLLYNVGAVVILGAAGLWSHPVGIGCWPAVVLHSVMTAWCVTRLSRKPPRTAG